MWTIKYVIDNQTYVYGREAETREEALTLGCKLEDIGDITMHSLVDPSGNVIMDYKDLRMHYIYEW